MKEEHPNRVTLEIPPKDVLTVTIGGYKFFRTRDANDYQCATCLFLMSTVAKSDIKPQEFQEVRTLFLEKTCDCPRQI